MIKVFRVYWNCQKSQTRRKSVVAFQEEIRAHLYLQNIYEPNTYQIKRMSHQKGLEWDCPNEGSLSNQSPFFQADQRGTTQFFADFDTIWSVLDRDSNGLNSIDSTDRRQNNSQQSTLYHMLLALYLPKLKSFHLKTCCSRGQASSKPLAESRTAANALLHNWSMQSEF